MIACERALTNRQLICQRTSSRISCSVGIQWCVCFACCRWTRAWQSDVWSYRRLKNQKKKKKNRLLKGLCLLWILTVTVTNFTFHTSILNFTLPVCSSVTFINTILMFLMHFNAKIILLLCNKSFSALLWLLMLQLLLVCWSSIMLQSWVQLIHTQIVIILNIHSIVHTAKLIEVYWEY